MNPITQAISRAPRAEPTPIPAAAPGLRPLPLLLRVAWGVSEVFVVGEVVVAGEVVIAGEVIVASGDVGFTVGLAMEQIPVYAIISKLSYYLFLGLEGGCCSELPR